MARVEGFEPARSEQEPADANGNPVPVGVWGDSNTGVGVFGTNGTLPPDVGNIPTNIAGVEGHSSEHPGVLGRSIQDAGVFGESIEHEGVVGRSAGGPGMLGVTFTPNSNGVFGVSTAGGTGVVGFVGGDATGVIGSSISGTGVQGRSGSGPGTLGLSETGAGVQGQSGSGPGTLGLSETGTGVQGQSRSREGTAGTSVTGTGVFGSSTEGTGVFGFSPSSVGVRGITNGGGPGVWGHAPNSTGVLGTAGGVGNGVIGRSVNSVAIAGFSETSTGVQGQSNSSGPGTTGFSTTGPGVAGVSESGPGIIGFSTTGPGVLGRTSQGFAGVFEGRVRVTGVLTKGGGGFEIDHPLDPGNKYLCHSFIESPDMLNVYNGNVTTDATGEASVTLPEYFEALNQDFRYQLTVIGQFAQAIVAEEIRNNQFTIKTDQPRVKVSWQVTGIRQDPWAVANRITAEEEKAAEDKGRYLHPELWGQPEEARVHRSPPRIDRLEEPPRIDRLEEPPRIDRLEEPPRIDRARLEEEWRQVEELVQRLHHRIPWKAAEGPTSPESH